MKFKKKYNDTLEKKSFYIKDIPSYFFINFNEMEKQINESYFFSDYTYYTSKIYEIAYLESDDINNIDLNTIEYSEKIDASSEKRQCVKLSENMSSNYVLLKITYKSTSILFNSFYYYFHIYENCITNEYNYRSDTFFINNDKETLLLFPYKYGFEIIISNNTNIKSLKTFKTDFFYFGINNKVRYNLLYVNILPSNNTSEINVIQDDINIKIFNSDYSIIIFYIFLIIINIFGSL